MCGAGGVPAPGLVTGATAESRVSGDVQGGGVGGQEKPAWDTPRL